MDRCRKYKKSDLQRLDISSISSDIYTNFFILTILDRIRSVDGATSFCVKVVPNDTILTVKNRIEETVDKYRKDDIELMIEEVGDPVKNLIMENRYRLRDYGITGTNFDDNKIISLIPKDKKKEWSADPEGMSLLWGGKFQRTVACDNYNKYYRKYMKYKTKYLLVKTKLL